MPRGLRSVAEVLLVGVAGFLVIAVPVQLDPGSRDYGSLMRNVVEGFKMYSLGLIASVGFAAGLFGRAPWVLLGVATMAGLPMWAVVDMARGHEHNLFPIEFAFYGFYAMFGVAGAWGGRMMRSRHAGTES